MENFRLRVFRAVARHLNFRAAAEELRLTQPAVTSQIKALESELATPLFSRSGGRVTLTPAGTALLPFALQLQQLAEQAQQAVQATTGLTAGRLAIGASQTIGQYLLPALIAAFLRQHPQVHVDILGGNTETILDALRTRAIHLALIEGPTLGNDVQATPFLEDHMVCVVPAAHPWASREIPVADLPTQTLLTREQGSGSRRIVESALLAAGLPPRALTLGLTFDSTEALLSAVEAGLGLAFVSRWAVRNQLALGSLKLAHLRGLTLTRAFSLVVPTGPEPTGLPGTFFRFVQQQAEHLTPRPTGHPKS